MNCEGCGAVLPEGAKACPACGRPVGLVQRAGVGTAQVAKETGKAVEKVGRGLLGGVKGFASGAKKGFKGSDEEKKE
jgi:RNA polymerase subunit RPABC4/transcription elongation factor Spt4